MVSFKKLTKSDLPLTEVSIHPNKSKERKMNMKNQIHEIIRSQFHGPLAGKISTELTEKILNIVDENMKSKIELVEDLAKDIARLQGCFVEGKKNDDCKQKA